MAPAPGSASSGLVARSIWRVTTTGGVITGEFVVAERWQRTFDDPLAPEHAFRAVLLTKQRGAVGSVNPRVRVLRPRRATAAPAHGLADATTPYGAIALVEEALATDATLPRFRRIAQDYLQTYAYLEGAAVPASHPELELDRTGLLEQLAPGYLSGNPDLWPAMIAGFEWFQARYRVLYRERHRTHTAATRAAHQRLLNLSDDVGTLQLLDGVTELGQPSGTAAIAAWLDALEQTDPCSVDDTIEDFVAVQPICAACGYAMDFGGDSTLVEVATAGVQAALSVQLRRLSSAAVQRILDEAHVPALDRFLRVLRASDIRDVVRVMDAGTAQFLRELLGTAQAEAPAMGVLAALRDRYAVMDESDIPAVVSDFERLLHIAVAEARSRGRSGPLRFRLE